MTGTEVVAFAPEKLSRIILGFFKDIAIEKAGNLNNAWNGLE
jgi:hypothetical protein